ncbi:hypothetical protein [Planktotalea sp.]|nr:hypothetical protein [Planktotalea sp.]
MSKTIKLVAVLGVAFAASACAKKAPVEEFVVVDPAPISMEPVYTGKYK